MMKSQIPRPDHALIDPKTGFPDKAWYRWFSFFAIDAAATEVTAKAALAHPPPNLQPLQTGIAETRLLATLAEGTDRRSWISALTNRVKTLEVLVFGARRAESASSSSSSSDTSWVPLVDGSEPPNFITDGAGNLIFVAYTP